MIPEEIEKVKEYSKKCEELYKEYEYLPEELESEIEDFVNGLINKYGWTITAHDTHRWVSCDGFYEVEFEMNTEFGDIYINTKSGGQDLQDEWSRSNPQNVELDKCYLSGYWDWCYFLKNLYEAYEKHQKEC